VALKISFVTLVIFTLLSCTTCLPNQQNLLLDSSIPGQQNKLLIKPPPSKAFVSLLSGVNISCLDRNNLSCRDGWHYFAGSGAVVAKTPTGSLVLSASHVCVVDPPKNIAKTLVRKIIVKNHLNQQLVARLVHHVWDKSSDLCLLEVPGLIVEPMKISKRSPQSGERVYAITAPGGRHYLPSGLILDGIYSGDINDGNTSITSIPSIGGVSGSPILTSEMEIIGVIFATNLTFKHETLSSSHINLLRFLRESFQKYLDEPRSGQ
jgi:hypothetical protein